MGRQYHKSAYFFGLQQWPLYTVVISPTVESIISQFKTFYFQICHLAVTPLRLIYEAHASYACVRLRSHARLDRIHLGTLRSKRNVSSKLIN